MILFETFAETTKVYNEVVPRWKIKKKTQIWHICQNVRQYITGWSFIFDSMCIFYLGFYTQTRIPMQGTRETYKSTVAGGSMTLTELLSEANLANLHNPISKLLHNGWRWQEKTALVICKLKMQFFTMFIWFQR